MALMKQCSFLLWFAFVMFVGLTIAPAAIPQISGEEIYEYMKELSAFVPNPPGTDNDVAQRQFLIKRFQTLGFTRVQEEVYPFPKEMHASRPRAGYKLYHITSNGKKEILCSRLWGGGDAPAQGLTAPLVYVGDGEDEDLEKNDLIGKIALVNARIVAHWFASYDFDLLVNPKIKKVDFGAAKSSVDNASKSIVSRIIERGALGIIMLWENAPSGEPFVQWVKVPRAVRDHFPVASVDGAIGLELVKAASLPQGVKVCIENAARNFCDDVFFPTGEFDQRTANVLAWLPGQTDEIIAIGGHINHFNVMNNASGIACLLGLANYFSQKPLAERKKTLLFIGFGSHGLSYQGSDDFVERHAEDILPKISVLLNMDHVAGKEFKFIHGQAYETGRDVARSLYVGNFNRYLLDAAETAIAATDLQPINRLPLLDNAGDAKSFWKAGVPTLWITVGPKQPWRKFQRFTPLHLEKHTKAYVEIVQYMDNISQSDVLAAEDEGRKTKLQEPVGAILYRSVMKTDAYESM